MSDAQLGAGPSAGDRLARGDLVGRYVIRHVIDAGAMGTVYAADDPELGRAVAIKLLHPRADGDPDRSRRMLLREAQSAARLAHPNVVTVHDVGTAGGRVFLAMELLDGPTLRAWMQQRHDWREVIAVMRPAGAALAAAHDAGVVHRDFKPDNVVFAGDARVVVTDFGLARRHDEHTATELDLADAPAPAADATDALGTAAYAAPEQLAGARADARSDQYAFCVVLHEALHARLPHTGAATTIAGPRASVGNARVPRWLDDVIARGLAVDPAARHRDMHALLEALDRGRARPGRTRWFAATALVCAAATAAWIGRAEPTSTSYCDRIRDRLTGVWDDPIRRELERAMLATGEPSAPDAWSLVESRLDRFTERWVAAAAHECEAQADGTADPTIATLRLTCLDRQLARAAALAEALRGADRQAVLRAGDLMTELPDVEACADDERLRRGAIARAEVDPRIQAELDALLSRADAQHRVADFQGSLASGRIVLARAQEVGDRWAIAEALVVIGLAEQWLERGAAESTLHDAFSAALAVENHYVAAAAIIALVEIWALSPNAEVTQSEQWVEHGRAAIAAHGGNVALEIALEGALGNVYLKRGRYDEAEVAYRRALGLFRGDVDEFLLAGVHANLGSISAARGRFVEALAAFRRAHELLLPVYGPLHPGTASALLNIGSALAELGDLEGARAAHREALEVLERNFGPEHPSLAPALRMLAWNGQARREFAEALPYARRAHAIAEAHDGEAESRARSLGMLSTIHLGLHDLPAAIAEAEDARTAAIAAFGPGHPGIAEFDIDLGLALSEAGRRDEARARFDAAIEIRARAFGNDDPEIMRAWHGIAELELARGRPRQARAAAERVLALASSPGIERTAARAEAAFLLARVLHAIGGRAERRRARELAEAAQVGFLDAGVGWDVRAREVGTWLTEHRAR